VGETSTRSVDVRLIAATNSNLESLVERGLFRQDLLFRLKVLHVRVPPLRERREDIPELAGSFLASLNERNKTKKRFHERALSRLGAGSYPGNVRELQNVVERAYYSTIDSNLIRDVGVTAAESPGAEDADVHGWYAALTKEGQDFWSVVHRRYKARDISREKVIALMDLGLRATRGSYKSVAALFNVEDKEYRRFMDFLRRNRCQPDFRPYRRLRE
jgi:DNA-binding NtrC family response regulator